MIAVKSFIEADPYDTPPELLDLIDVQMECHGKTETGRIRLVNEDQFLIAELRKSMVVHQSSALGSGDRSLGEKQGYLLLVADGLGGHAKGNQASKLAVETVVQSLVDAGRIDLEEELIGILKKCHSSIRSEAARIPECKGMGTTLTMAYIFWPWLYVIHAGDSRCYLLHNSRLRQITKDHTRAQQLVDGGFLDPDLARQSPWHYALWNAVGGNSDDLEPEARKMILHLGDTLLLCTDGLTEELSNEEILKIIREEKSAEGCCKQLISSAKQKGGQDDATVAVARFY